MNIFALLKVIFLLVLVFCPRMILASDKDGSFAIKGVGALTCSRFIELSEHDTAAFLQFGGWMNGYISALNESTSETFDLVDFENSDTLISYVTKYCETYPKHRFIFAVKAIIQSLMPIRVTNNNEALVSFKSDQTILLYQQTVDWIVAELVDLGYLIESPSRPSILEIGAALSKYQKDESLPESGQPTQKTLVNLLRKRE